MSAFPRPTFVPDDVAPPGPRMVELPGTHDVESITAVVLFTLDHGERFIDANEVMALSPDRVSVRVPWQIAGRLTARFADGTSVEVPVRPLGHVRRYCNALMELFHEIPATVVRLGYGDPTVHMIQDSLLAERVFRGETVPPMFFTATRSAGGTLLVAALPSEGGVDVRAFVDPISLERPDEIVAFFEELESTTPLELYTE